MNWPVAAAWVGATVVGALVLYGLHRLGLHLEERGLMYYWHKQPETGAAGMWMPLREIVEPQVRHVIEAEEQYTHRLDEASGEPDRDATSLVYPGTR
jgi:hypothetical protein